MVTSHFDFVKTFHLLRPNHVLHKTNNIIYCNLSAKFHGFRLFDLGIVACVWVDFSCNLGENVPHFECAAGGFAIRICPFCLFFVFISLCLRIMCDVQFQLT